MTSTASIPETTGRVRRAPDFHGACLVDERGVETPITETMVRAALDRLEAAWQREHRDRRDG